MARRRRQDDPDAPLAVAALAVAGGLLGWWDDARDFVVQRWHLFGPLAVALVLLTVLMVRHRIVESRRRRQRQQELDRLVSSTDGMSGAQFEHLVARLLRRDGWSDVQVCGGSNDLGADVVATGKDGRRLVVQCKRYGTSKVSSPDMQRFLGTCFSEHGADEAWFVTTSGFTPPAAELGCRRGVRLLDRGELAGWMARTAPVPGATVVQAEVETPSRVSAPVDARTMTAPDHPADRVDAGRGTSPAPTARMREVLPTLRQVLVEAASRRGTLTYSEVCRAIGAYQPRSLGPLLAALGDDCSRRGEPDLAALVVSAATGEVGTGFTGDAAAVRTQLYAFWGEVGAGPAGVGASNQQL